MIPTKEVILIENIGIFIFRGSFAEQKFLLLPMLLILLVLDRLTHSVMKNAFKFAEIIYVNRSQLFYVLHSNTLNYVTPLDMLVKQNGSPSSTCICKNKVVSIGLPVKRKKLKYSFRKHRTNNNSLRSFSKKRRVEKVEQNIMTLIGELWLKN